MCFFNYINQIAGIFIYFLYLKEILLNKQKNNGEDNIFFLNLIPFSLKNQFNH